MAGAELAAHKTPRIEFVGVFILLFITMDAPSIGEKKRPFGEVVLTVRVVFCKPMRDTTGSDWSPAKSLLLKKEKVSEPTSLSKRQGA